MSDPVTAVFYEILVYLAIFAAGAAFGMGYYFLKLDDRPLPWVARRPAAPAPEQE